jgi:hypothetical protein
MIAKISLAQLFGKLMRIPFILALHAALTRKT